MAPSTLAVSPMALASDVLAMSTRQSDKTGIDKINSVHWHNRIMALMVHTTHYAFQGETRLAQDAGVSKSAVCRLLNGHSSPSFALVMAITKALELRLGRPLDPRDLISLDGCYPTASVCELAGCRGCLPPEAYDEADCLRPEFRDMQPGHWCIAPQSLAIAPGEENVPVKPVTSVDVESGNAC
ncbi:hypothetical protein IAD21_06021 [Abditibacteriota bacterium]|nr:hypothetical protein IAD21_06021 [Abditibacteriota bacterium]